MIRSASILTGLRAPSADASLRLALLAGGLLIALSLGGSSRADAITMPLLRPVALALFVGALVLATGDATRVPRGPVVWIAALFLTASLYCLPLPAGMANALPGHGLIAAIDTRAFGGALPRPASVDPAASRDFLWDLPLPCAIFLLAIGMPAAAQARIQSLLLGFGLVSVGLAVLQLSHVGGANWQIHTIANFGDACGFFANRNHFALFLALLIPLLFLWAPDHLPHHRVFRAVGWAAVAIALAWILLLIAVGGARIGAVASVAALLTLPFLFSRRVGRISRRGWVAMAGLAGGMALLLAFAFANGRATTLERLGSIAVDGSRIALWRGSTVLLARFWPIGAGPGSFATAYRMLEPDALLSPDYANHAHNDWLETAETLGLPGMLWMAAGLLLLAARLWHLAHRPAEPGAQRRLRRCGLAIVLILLLGSVTDYPLRTPALASLFALACAWLWRGARTPGATLQPPRTAQSSSVRE